MRQLKITTQITNRDSRSIERYLQEISRIKVLEPEQIDELMPLIRKGDIEALNQVVQANLRFVVSVAKQYQHQGLSLADLINEGNIGLIDAIQRFDETKKFKLISYAVWWIRQSILKALAEQGRLVRLPQHKVNTYGKVDRIKTAFEQEHEREPSIEELSELLEIEEVKINTILQCSTRHTSLDVNVRDSEDIIMSDLLPGTFRTDAQLMDASLKEGIKLLLKVLNPREFEIVTAYFSLDEEKGQTVDQIGQKYGLTNERIRQIKERAIKRLQRHRYSVALRNYFV